MSQLALGRVPGFDFSNNALAVGSLQASEVEAASDLGVASLDLCVRGDRAKVITSKGVCTVIDSDVDKGRVLQYHANSREPDTGARARRQATFLSEAIFPKSQESVPVRLVHSR